jgi:hypothetical protein
MRPRDGFFSRAERNALGVDDGSGRVYAFHG